MPNPKSGTVTPNIGNAIRDIKAGKVEYRLDKTAIVHTLVGKANFEEQALLENIDTLARRDRARQAVGLEGHLPASDHAREHDGPGRQDRPEPRQSHRLGVQRSKLGQTNPTPQAWGFLFLQKPGY